MKAFVEYSHVDLLLGHTNRGGANTSSREKRRLEQRFLIKNLDAQIKAGKISNAMRSDLVEWIKTDTDKISKYLVQLINSGRTFK